MIEMKVFMPILLNVEQGMKVKVSLDKDGLYKVYANDIEIGLARYISTLEKLKDSFYGKVISCENNYLLLELDNPIA